MGQVAAKVIPPMVDDGELVAVVTSRDMYIALATRNELLADGNHNLRMRDIR